MPLLYFRPLCLPCLVLLFAACRPPEISTYTVARPEAPPPATMADDSVILNAITGELSWTAPDSWQAKPRTPARLGSYSVRGPAGAEADLAITSFPGDVGGEAANINRWCSQIGLPPMRAEDLAAAITRLEYNGLQFAVVDLGGGDQRILGAMVPYGGSTWFFKMLGPDALVTAEKAAFLALLQSVMPPAP